MQMTTEQKEVIQRLSDYSKQSGASVFISFSFFEESVLINIKISQVEDRVFHFSDPQLAVEFVDSIEKAVAGGEIGDFYWARAKIDMQEKIAEIQSQYDELPGE